MRMKGHLYSMLGGFLMTLSGSLLPYVAAQAQTPIASLGEGFASGNAIVNGTSIHYVRGGSGPAILLIHGFPRRLVRIPSRHARAREEIYGHRRGPAGRRRIGHPRLADLTPRILPKTFINLLNNWSSRKSTSSDMTSAAWSPMPTSGNTRKLFAGR